MNYSSVWLKQQGSSSSRLTEDTKRTIGLSERLIHMNSKEMFTFMNVAAYIQAMLNIHIFSRSFRVASYIKQER